MLDIKKMKRKANFLALLIIAALIQAGTVNAQDNFSIRSAKFVTPLLQKWVDEYSKAHPRMRIQIVDNKDNGADINISVSNDAENRNAYTVGRYAILPVAGKDNRLLADLQKKKLNGKRLKELYFEQDIFDEDYEQEKENKYNVTVYAGNKQQSVTVAFAEYFGYEAKALKGKKIAGDDIYLIHAIQKDNSGISFNNLNYIFDLRSRRLKDEISLLPLDLKKEYTEILSESNLDKTIELLERKKFDLIPVEELTFEVSNADNPEIQQFLQWILTEGQSYNHEFGFLNVENKNLAQH
jgi:ABC-type phosphate transport system substrate-binding protein